MFVKILKTIFNDWIKSLNKSGLNWALVESIFFISIFFFQIKNSFNCEVINLEAKNAKKGWELVFTILINFITLRPPHTQTRPSNSFKILQTFKLVDDFKGAITNTILPQQIEKTRKILDFQKCYRQDEMIWVRRGKQVLKQEQ